MIYDCGTYKKKKNGVSFIFQKIISLMYLFEYM